MRKWAIVLALAIVAVLALPRTAAAADEKNMFGVFVGYIEPTGDYTDGGFKIELDSTVGYGLAYQYRPNDLFSFGADFLMATHDVKASMGGSSETVGDVSLMAFLFDGNFHILKDAKTLDFYLGPTLGYAMWGDWKIDGEGNIKTKDTFAYGVNFGLDVPFADTWAFNAGLRYLFLSTESDESGDNIEIDVNPWMLTAGVSYKF